jgi:hypothetical protein
VIEKFVGECMIAKSWLLRAASLAAVLTMALPAAAGVQAKGSAPGGTSGSTRSIVRLGTVNLSSIGGSTTQLPGNTASVGEIDKYAPADDAVPKTHTAPAHLGSTPNPKGTTITTSNPGSGGFNGISHADQRLAGTNNGTFDYTNTQFSLEPPDQALCTNGNYVMEGVNNAIKVFKTNGTTAQNTTALSQFWGIAPEVIRTDPNKLVYGPFISDPKCLYDVSTSRWFLTELELDRNPATGAEIGPSHQFIAVSQSNDPTGGWSLYEYDTTDDGTNNTPSHAACPCFGDQPLIGADAYGFYISTNEFPTNGPGFNGAQVYALSKTLLESGAATIPFVQFQGGSIPASNQYPGGLSYSVQPATVPTTHFDTANGGTEFFLSATEFTGTLDNRVVTWALTNTSSLASASPNLTFQHVVIGSETYGMGGSDFAVPQNSGPRPLEQTLPGNSNPESLNANDDRMNQTVYADGMLWSGVNSLTVDENGTNHVGIAYFIVAPSFDSQGNLGATVSQQGYESVSGNTNLFFPSIGVNDQGQGVMAFSLSGPSYYPSVGYVSMSPSGASGPVHLSAVGQAPDDGFTGYPAFGGNGIGRWGDYSAAVADPSGTSIWTANEWIPNTPRTVNANWGTFIGHISL